MNQKLHFVTSNPGIPTQKCYADDPYFPTTPPLSLIQGFSTRKKAIVRAKYANLKFWDPYFPSIYFQA